MMVMSTKQNKSVVVVVYAAIHETGDTSGTVNDKLQWKPPT